MHPLVANVSAAVHPLPVPVVMEAIFGEGTQWSGTGPEIVVNAGRNGLLFGFADGVAALVTKPLGHVDVADDPFAKLLDGLLNSCAAADLRSVLDDAMILSRRLHHL